MLDVYGLPTREGVDLQQFNRPCTVTNLQWETWRKPRGVRMCFIYCVGGGGGGGGGFTGVLNANRNGGGGGGSSGQTRVLIPSDQLPDVLYIQAGAGGSGVASGGGTAGSGILSFVAVAPNNTATNVVAVSGAVGAVGGVTGTGGLAGAGGAASTIAVIASMPLAALGHFAFIAGQSGLGANTLVNGSSQSIPTTSVMAMGGASGGGGSTADSAGGGVTLTALAYLSEQAPVGPATGLSSAGSSGTQVQKPFFGFGGCGGSATNAAAGGVGGYGAYGAGGAGGGGGTTGGRGGNGGNGMVMILSWG